jgi:transcriptional regulator with XRE-family HTH domain
MKKYSNEAIRVLRKTIGMTQAEFAEMIGVSKDAVVSWELGRNRISATFARRIGLATGVDGKTLHSGVSVPFSSDREAHVYTAADFEKHQQTEWGRSDEASARRHLEHCVDTLELLLLAAVPPAGERRRQRLPGLMDSFMQWCESAREDFKLGAEIDQQLARRPFKAGIKQTMREWRAMERNDPAALRAAGFIDDPSKGDQEERGLELDCVPGWAPGRSMKPPKPAIMQAVLDEGKS